MNSSSHVVLKSIRSEIRNLNVRTISKIVASKIMTYEAVAYFVDNQFFEEYGFQQVSLISLQNIHDQLLTNFYDHLTNTPYYPM